jgi:hypothetical protein
MLSYFFVKNFEGALAWNQRTGGSIHDLLGDPPLLAAAS